MRLLAAVRVQGLPFETAGLPFAVKGFPLPQMRLNGG
jgi:hypothetical protein